MHSMRALFVGIVLVNADSFSSPEIQRSLLPRSRQTLLAKTHGFAVEGLNSRSHGDNQGLHRVVLVAKESSEHEEISTSQTFSLLCSQVSQSATAAVVPATLRLRGGALRTFFRGAVSLPTFLLSLLVVHKCVTDTLSQYTRTTGVPYSANTVAILGEVIKVSSTFCAGLMSETGFDQPIRALIS